MGVGHEGGLTGHTALTVSELAAADYSTDLLRMRGASSDGCEVVDHEDGTYSLTIARNATGRYSIHAFVNEKPAMPVKARLATSAPSPHLSTSPAALPSPAPCCAGPSLRDRALSRGSV